MRHDGEVLSAQFSTDRQRAASVLLGKLLLRSRDMPNNSEKVMPINSESDRLWESSCVFFWSIFCVLLTRIRLRTCRALSETKVSTSWLSPMESDNLSDKKERKIIPKLTSATHVLPVVTFPLSLGFAAGNLE
jgi:hypothetical protein